MFICLIIYTKSDETISRTSLHLSSFVQVAMCILQEDWRSRFIKRIWVSKLVRASQSKLTTTILNTKERLGLKHPYPRVDETKDMYQIRRAVVESGVGRIVYSPTLPTCFKCSKFFMGRILIFILVVFICFTILL